MMTMDKFTKLPAPPLHVNRPAYPHGFYKRVLQIARQLHSEGQHCSRRIKLAPLHAVRADKDLDQADSRTLQLIADITKYELPEWISSLLRSAFLPAIAVHNMLHLITVDNLWH